MTNPDVGDFFEYNSNRYRVTAWAKDYPELEYNDILDGEPNFNQVLSRILESSARRFGKNNKRIVFCTRDEAMYVCGSGVCGCLAAIEDIKITGRVSWNEDAINSERDTALLFVGKLIA